jgi:hypothetical protein
MVVTTTKLQPPHSNPKPPMNTHPADYFILRNGKTHGPCSLDELRTYISYGSMQPNDMVSPAGRAEWSPAAKVLASIPEPDERGSADSDPWLARLLYVLRRTAQQFKGRSADSAPPLEMRHRVVRFREWEKVPLRARGTNVIWRMIGGFLCNPPQLWAACAQVFSGRVFRRSTDEEGYLKTWSRNMESFCAALIVLHTMVWCVLIVVLSDKAAPFIKIASQIMTESYKELMNG